MVQLSNCVATRLSTNSKTPKPTLRPQPEPVVPRGAWIALLLFAAGLTLGWVLHVPAQPGDGTGRATYTAATPAAELPATDVTQVRAGPAGKSHHLLFCNGPAAVDTAVDLQSHVEKAIAEAKGTLRLARASVVYRDLESMRGFEIGGADQFHPASLLKLPLAIAWMRRAELDPAVLDRKLQYNNQTMREDAGVPGALLSGETYTVRELLDRMIRWSRNDAKSVLLGEIGEDAVRKVYADLGISWPFSAPEADADISANDYSRMFRVLYDASIVHPAQAEELLGMLTKTEFKDALSAGVPAGTEVAHKWGRRVLKVAQGKEIEQLHDCGIVYRASRPFLLCVMTGGRDMATLSQVIAKIAKLAWDDPGVHR